MKNVFRTSILLFILFCFCKQSKGQDLILFEPDSTDYFINLNENDLLSKTTIDENNAYILRSISHDPSNTLAKHYLYLLRYNLDGSYVNKIPLGIQTMVVATYSYLSVLPNDSSLLVMFYNGFSYKKLKLFIISKDLSHIIKSDSTNASYDPLLADFPCIKIENDHFNLFNTDTLPNGNECLSFTRYDFSLNKIFSVKTADSFSTSGAYPRDFGLQNFKQHIVINRKDSTSLISYFVNQQVNNLTNKCIQNIYITNTGNISYELISDSILGRFVNPQNLVKTEASGDFTYYHILSENDLTVSVYKWDIGLKILTLNNSYKLDFGFGWDKQLSDNTPNLNFENGDFSTQNKLYKVIGNNYASLQYNTVKIFPDSNYIYLQGRYVKTNPYYGFGSNIIKFKNDYYITGFLSIGTPTYLTVQFMKKISDGYGSVSGKVYKDLNKNCAKDNTDKPFKNILIEVANSHNPNKYYINSADSGKYEVFVDTGNYTMKSIAPNNYWENCITNQPIQIDTLVSNYTQDFGLKKLVVCPKLSVSISTGRLRQCTQSTYFVNYCNRGTSDAIGASVVVDFDSLLAVNSASVPYTNIGNKYTFQIGNILEDACGQFTITTTLNCDAVLGTTQCVTAHIYPDTICAPIDPRWDRANVAVDGRCLGDSVLFRIRNIGSGNMSQIKKYIVIEDNVLRIMPINFQLNAGQEILLKRPANGTTQRLYAEQVDYFPYPSNPTAVVENCGGLNPGFVTQFPNNDGADFIAINCTQNRNSYDPNDKEGTPTGFDNQHYIAKKTDINYKIRFQNTGTDTAYDIYILDTISNKLDVSKLQMGASSHPYSYEIYGEGVAVLKVIFRNINLVDSFHNEPLSHGFFTYSIAQDTLNKANDKIYNHADIYFDANNPVKTNTTLHTVTDSYFRIISSVIENKIKAATNAYPNPFNDKCTIEIKSDNKQNTTYQFKLYNLNGALIQTQTVTNKVELFAADLPAAIYLYRIEHDGELVAAGKIVKE